MTSAQVLRTLAAKASLHSLEGPPCHYLLPDFLTLWSGSKTVSSSALPISAVPAEGHLSTLTPGALPTEPQRACVRPPPPFACLSPPVVPFSGSPGIAPLPQENILSLFIRRENDIAGQGERRALVFGEDEELGRRSHLTRTHALLVLNDLRVLCPGQCVPHRSTKP
ncbi:hypothetical protein SRHO_G00000830 [Serrasalmus rhombeus]